MAWNSRGLRGSMLEEMINLTNEKYRDRGLALIQKVPTPNTPIEIDKKSRHITLAYFDQKSTVDYIGAIQGIPVCFDAKECACDTFALANVHEHQVRFMHEFEAQDGVAFLIIYYKSQDKYYYMRLRELEIYTERAVKGGRKSIRFDELNADYFFRENHGMYVPYLEMIKKDLEERQA